MKTNNENKKAIIFARVSTEAQDYTEQVNRMTAVAMVDGYKKDNLIVISNKESAIKLAEDEREGLQQLQSAIAADSAINAVYVFEISRLGRRMDVISSVVQWLTDSHIQLVCDTPNVRLFERDGSVSFGGQMMIYLMGVMAAQEMKIKRERFANGKKHAKEQGKWIGGTVMFGFKIENQREVVDLAAAEVIRHAFAMYAADENRTAQTNEDIAAYLRANNVCVRSDKFFAASRVAKFIGQTKYRGTIVSEELFDKCQAIKENNYRGSKERKQSFGERLIKCSDCGHNYRRVAEQYVCAAHKKEYKGSEMYCDNNATLNRKYVDCSLVETVAAWWIDEQKKDNTERMQQTQQQIEKLSARLTDAQSKLDKVSDKKRRIGKNYENGIYSDEDFDKAIKSVNADEKQLKADVANITARIAELESQLSGGNELKTWPEQWQSFNSLTHAEMYEAIHRLVDYVSVKVEDGKKFWTIHRKDSEQSQTYMSYGHGCGVKLFGYINGVAHELTNNPAFKVDYDKEQVREMKDAAQQAERQKSDRCSQKGCTYLYIEDKRVSDSTCLETLYLSLRKAV